MTLPIFIISFVLSFALNGCVMFSSEPTQLPVELKTKFIGTEHDEFIRNGSNSINGSTVLHTDNGGEVNCSGNEVLLMPATSFFREVIKHIKDRHQVNYEASLPSSFSHVVKKSQCDSLGGFSFGGLPNCHWFIVTRVAWIIAGLQQGGTLIREVKGCSPDAIVLTNIDVAAP